MGKQAEVPRLPEEEVQRSAQPWSLPLPCSWQDFLEVCPRNGPAQDRARQGCSEALQTFEGVPPPYDKKKRMVIPSALKVLRLKHGRRFCSLGRLGHEVGWKYQDIIESLEAKRKVKGETFYKGQKEVNKAKTEILKDPKIVKKIAPLQATIEALGHK